MEDYDGFPWKPQKIQRTRILPLRWIGNLSGSIATNHLLKAVYLDEDGDNGLAYKYHAKMWKYLNKPYELWGTYYAIEMVSNKIMWDEE